MYVYVCMCACSVVSYSFVTPWSVAHQACCPWDSPGKNTGVGCHFLLQEIFLTQGLNPSPESPALAGEFSILSHQGSIHKTGTYVCVCV